MDVQDIVVVLAESIAWKLRTIPRTTQEFWIQVKGLPLVLMTQAMGEEIERPLCAYITTDCKRGGDCLESAEDLGGIGCVQTVTVRDEDEVLGWQWGLGMGGFKKSGSGTTRAPLFQEEDTAAEDFMPNDYPGGLAFLSLEAVKRVEQLEFYNELAQIRLQLGSIV
ncbi:hypothetical protein ACFX1W_028651 [Malus domestica]